MNQKILKLFKILDSLNFPIYVSDIYTNKIIYSNIRSTNILGYDVLGKNSDILFKNELSNKTFLIETISKKYDDKCIDICIIFNTNSELIQINDFFNKVLKDDQSLSKYEYIAKSLENSFESIKSRSEIYFEYQPKIQNSTLEVIGYEVLTRWNHEKHGYISPLEFLSFFIVSDHIKKFDLFVFEHAFKFQEYLRGIGIYTKCSVNLSVMSMKDTVVINNICNLVDKFNIPTSSITIEILEHDAIDYSKSFLKNISKLKQKGFKLAIDDFGIGYSSLDKLYNLDIDELKIAREFILDIDNNSKKASVLKCIADLSINLNIETVVEGIEDEDTFELIKDMGFLNSQGFLHSKSLSKDKFIEYITFKNNILKESG
ncbi:MAG: EAL domain-containing protein [Filifactoraceae bacterium]